jgi:hypothetical protein
LVKDRRGRSSEDTQKGGIRQVSVSYAEKAVGKEKEKVIRPVTKSKNNREPKKIHIAKTHKRDTSYISSQPLKELVEHIRATGVVNEPKITSQIWSRVLEFIKEKPQRGSDLYSVATNLCKKSWGKRGRYIHINRELMVGWIEFQISIKNLECSYISGFKSGELELKHKDYRKMQGSSPTDSKHVRHNP